MSEFFQKVCRKFIQNCLNSKIEPSIKERAQMYKFVFDSLTKETEIAWISVEKLIAEYRDACKKFISTKSLEGTDLQIYLDKRTKIIEHAFAYMTRVLNQHPIFTIE